MINKNHLNRLDILKHYIERWGREKRLSRQAIAMEIVQQFEKEGLDKATADEDIFFSSNGDAYTVANAAQQKIFRWLGVLADGEKRCVTKLFFIEGAIVNAMPPKIRIDYLSEVYLNARISAPLDCESGKSDVKQMLASMTKENAEAQVAVIQLPDNPTLDHLKNARKEISESASINQAALEALDEKIAEITEEAEQ